MNLSLNSVFQSITVAVFPLVLSRIISRLFSAITFSDSSSILDDLNYFIYFYSDNSTAAATGPAPGTPVPALPTSSLIIKFSEIISLETGLHSLPLKITTILVYLVYTLSVSGYLMIISVFFVLCFGLTFIRRTIDLTTFRNSVYQTNGIL